MGGALQAPPRGGADRQGDIGGVDPDGRVAIVAELIAPVFESLAEAVELGPGGVAGRTRQVVFSREGGDRCRLVGREGETCGGRQHPPCGQDVRFPFRTVSISGAVHCRHLGGAVGSSYRRRRRNQSDAEATAEHQYTAPDPSATAPVLHRPVDHAASWVRWFGMMHQVLTSGRVARGDHGNAAKTWTASMYCDRYLRALDRLTERIDDGAPDHHRRGVGLGRERIGRGERREEYYRGNHERTH